MCTPVGQGRVHYRRGHRDGRATALRFAGEGARVVVAEINAVTGEETAHLAGNGAIAIVPT